MNENWVSKNQDMQFKAHNKKQLISDEKKNLYIYIKINLHIYDNQTNDKTMSLQE